MSFARIAGVTADPANRFSLIVRISLEFADISMMSTSPCFTISRIWSRYSASDRVRPVAGSIPGDAIPNAMSASFASARMKSFAPLGFARMLAILISSDFIDQSISATNDTNAH